MLPSKPPALADFVANVAGDAALRVEESFGDGFVRLRVGEAERRQAKHDIRCVEDAVIELLRNSRDAHASCIFVATIREGDQRSIVILDDGDGIPLDMQERVFEARVTSKLETFHLDRWGVHGRGMALYSVKQNSVEAKVMASAPDLGTSLRVVTDATSLPERADQSTWPTVSKAADEEMVAGRSLRGPHNICRTCAEFALEERENCVVYLGSPAEIIATVRQVCPRSVSERDLLFLDGYESLPVIERLKVASDARELREVASGLGLSISERTAHRIVNGQVRPLRSVKARLLHETSASPSANAFDDLLHDHRGLRFDEDDLKEFSRAVERDFQSLAERYYLVVDGEPRVRVSGDRITVTFNVQKTD